MRALLLAAGLGTRLKPLTNYLPKCLVPIHGRPLLDYWLEALIANGVNEILINTHYHSSLVVEYVQRSSWAHNVTIVYEDELLGTGGTILKNRHFFRKESFMVAHADNLTIFDLSLFLKHHRDRPFGTELTMMVFETPDPQSCGIVDLDERGVVVSFHEKVKSPPGNLANAAVYILDPSVLNILKSMGKVKIDFSTEVIPKLMRRISAFRNFEYHRDIGTMASWTEAHKDFPEKSDADKNSDAWSYVLSSVDPGLDSLIRQVMPAE